MNGNIGLFLPQARRQRGATLLIAIVMLLLITVLAISSIRGVTLESRITANLKQEKIFQNAAEAGLRYGESCVTSQATTQLIVDNCAGRAPSTNTSVDAAPSFTASATTVNIASATKNWTAADTSFISTNTSEPTQVQWYVVSLGTMGAAVNGNALTGSGTQYFEINACASSVLCTADTTTRRTILRSVVAKTF